MAKTQIPANAAQFSISVVGDRTGETFAADFITTEILSHRQQLLQDRLYREYVGGENPQFADEDTQRRARILAEINCALVGLVPQFWRERGMGLDLLDDNVLIEVWKGVQKVQADKAKAIDEKTAKAAARLQAKVEAGPDAPEKPAEEDEQ